MIVKKIKYTNFDKPKAYRIGNLIDYIRNPQATNAHEKIAHAGSRNFITDTHHGQKAEMIALSQETVHSRMPIAHWIFSWKEGEQPTHKQVDEVVDIFLAGMELEGHQTIYALHQNTDNYHMHIAVNRMNEITEKVVQPHKGFDIEAAHKIVALIEHKQGWQSEENARYKILEHGELVKRRPTYDLRTPRPKAINFENATGGKSAQRIAQERGYKIIAEAQTWAELHEELAKINVRFEKKGSGAIVWVGDIAIKASSIHRRFSMGKLCEKLGDFVAGNYSKKLEKLPIERLSIVNHKEWWKFQQEKHNSKRISPITERNQALAQAKERHKQERRNAIEMLKLHGISILNIARYFLNRQQKEELQTIHEEYRKKTKTQPRSSNFETWLIQQGLHREANLWRHRRTLVKPQQAKPSLIQNNSVEEKAFESYAQAVSADRYRVTCIKMPNPEKDNGSKKAFLLDKRNGESKGFTAEEMPHFLPQMLRIQRSRENIYYTPLSENKHHILIDDMTIESVEKFMQDGFKPAVVLESSPNNYQCILTIPKLQSAFDRDIGNRLTERLNKLYGDPKLSGCIHPHRAPAFSNFKLKHQRNGMFPKVRLAMAKKQECDKAFALSRQILQEYEASAQAKKERVLHVRNVPTSPLPIGSSTKAFYAHYLNIRNHMQIEDFSRMDAMVALRMRVTGHSPQDVFEAVLECAPNIRWKEGRDWQKYAERTANYAFGVAGDMALQKHDKYHEYWYRIEHGQSQEENTLQERTQSTSPRMRM